MNELPRPDEPLGNAPFRVSIENSQDISGAVSKRGFKIMEQWLLREKTDQDYETELQLGSISQDTELFSLVRTSVNILAISNGFIFQLDARYVDPQTNGYWSQGQVDEIKKILSGIYGENNVRATAAETFSENTSVSHELYIRDSVAEEVFFLSLGFETYQDQADVYSSYLDEGMDEELLDDDDEIMTQMFNTVASLFSRFPSFYRDPLPKITAGTLTPVGLPLDAESLLSIWKLQSILSDADESDEFLSYISPEQEIKGAQEQSVKNQKDFLIKLQRWGYFVESVIRAISQVKREPQSGTLIIRPPEEK